MGQHARKNTLRDSYNSSSYFKKGNHNESSSGEKDRDTLGQGQTGNDISIVSGSDEEEVMQNDQLDQSGGQLDQDFEFIDEVLASHMEDIQNKEAVLLQV